MFSRPSRIPDFSREKRRSSKSALWLHVCWSRGGERRLGNLGGDGAHEPQRPSDRGLHVATIDDEVEHAAFNQELTALKPFGQLLTDRLLDDARARKSDKCLGFRDVHVA